MRVLGVDGCKGGWVAVVLDDGVFAGADAAASFADLLDRHPKAHIVAVDIPIGMVASGLRLADAEARRLLPTHLKPTVFNAPPRAALDAVDYMAACAACEELTHKKLSKQSYALGVKIRDVEPHWEAAPERIYEVHPELSFQELATRPLQHPKKTWNGHQERAALLERAGIALPAQLAHAGRAAPDDLFDAAVVAWSAQRIATGHHRSVPQTPERDVAGREVAIWY